MEQQKRYKYLSLITGLFVTSLLISCVTASKVFEIGPLVLSVGIFIFPLAYIFGDILTEVYGYAESRRVIWTGFIAEALMIVFLQAAVAAPHASFWPGQECYAQTFAQVPRIVVASISAYLFGEFCNSYVLARMKVKTEGRGMGIRFILSTFVGEAVDSLIFFPIAFLGLFPTNQVIVLLLSSWACKVLWEICALPLTLPLVKHIKKVEQEDFYDKNTNFNPLQF